MINLTPEQWAVLKKLLLSRYVEFGIGADLDRDLTEDEDFILWSIIEKFKEAGQ